MIASIRDHPTPKKGVCLLLPKDITFELRRNHHRCRRRRTNFCKCLPRGNAQHIMAILKYFECASHCRSLSIGSYFFQHIKSFPPSFPPLSEDLFGVRNQPLNTSQANSATLWLRPPRCLISPNVGIFVTKISPKLYRLRTRKVPSYQNCAAASKYHFFVRCSSFHLIRNHFPPCQPKLSNPTPPVEAEASRNHHRGVFFS